MKYLIIFVIRLYWLIPKSRRRKCIFRISCSKCIYKTAMNEGFIAACYAFKYRYKNCRYGYELFRNPITNDLEIRLPNNDIVPQKDIAERFL